MKPVQSPQGGLPIGSNIEARHSENESMQNVFQRIEGGKMFDGRTSHSLFPLYPPADSGIYVLPCESRAYPGRAASYIWLEQLSQPRPRLKARDGPAHHQKCRCVSSGSRSLVGMRQPPICKRTQPTPGWIEPW